jgi:hypothetical protein
MGGLMLKMDAKTLSDLYKSSGSCGIRRSGRLRLFRITDQGLRGKKNARKKDDEDEECSVPTLG